jgi:crotonobetainyl-CoA:carnitine CoA-transferase CaiB-like acyl-CoA transferase
VDKPLSGLKVLELARILAGPWAGQLLADLGAEVVKVERPGSGDDTRGWGPPFVEGEGSAAYFHACNRGKKSVAIDFETPDGREQVRALAGEADILIENYKVGGLAKHGLDYPSLSALNPRLIYCSITGFGQDGPYAPRAGYDFMIQGMGGIMDLTGDPAGEPQKIGVAFADIFTGVYAANAILAHCTGARKRPRLPHRHGFARHPESGAREPGDELPCLGQDSAPARQCPPQHRAVPDVAVADGWVIVR